MQPSASAIDGVKLIKGEVGVESMVNEATFLKRRAQDVPVDQVLCFSPPLLYAELINFRSKRFFHQYFTRKDEKEKAMAAKGRKRKGDEDEDDQEEDDEEADGAGKASSDDAGNEVAEVDVEDDSDADEAEIWKVSLCLKGLFERCSSFLTPFNVIGNEGYYA